MGIFSSRKHSKAVSTDLFQLLVQAFTSMHYTYLSQSKPLGGVLRDAAKNSMEKMLIIGGFIISFSVLIEILSVLGILKIIAELLGLIFAPFGLAPSLMLPLSSGIFEMTIGIKMISESGAPILQQLLCISFILGWAGLSVHAQVAAFISDQNISSIPYFSARILQGAIATTLAYLLFNKNLSVLGVSKAPIAILSGLNKAILICKIIFIIAALYFILNFLASILKKSGFLKK